MFISINELEKIKGVGPKMIERIKKHINANEKHSFVSQYDKLYDIPPNTICLGETIETMQGIKTNTVDLILTDLPYGITRNKWDQVIDYEKLWKTYERITKESGTIILFATMNFANELINAAHTYSNFKFKYDLIWSKNKATGFLNAKKQPLRNHELILVFHRSVEYYKPLLTDGHKKSNYAKKVGSGENYGKTKVYAREGTTTRYPKSILKYNVVNNDDPKRIHPTQKPIQLLEWLIESYSKKDELVLDNTMGSGSTIIAAINKNRKYIGIEKENKYFYHTSKEISKLMNKKNTHII